MKRKAKTKPTVTRAFYRDFFEGDVFVIEKTADGTIVGSCIATEPLKDLDSYECKPDKNESLTRHSQWLTQFDPDDFDNNAASVHCLDADDPRYRMALLRAISQYRREDYFSHSGQHWENYSRAVARIYEHFKKTHVYDEELGQVPVAQDPDQPTAEDFVRLQRFLLKLADAERAAIENESKVEAAKNPKRDNLPVVNGLEAKIQREPLSGNAQIVYDILMALPPHKAMTTPQILDEVAEKYKKFWDAKELYNRIFPQLVPWGLKKKNRVGYWIEKSFDTPT